MTTRSDVRKKTRLWYLLPIFLHVIGGLIAYFALRASDPALAKNTLLLGIILSAVITAVSLAVYTAYLNDLSAINQSISTGSTVIDTVAGPIEYADIGKGDNIVLAIHGTGGGFDQSILTAKSFIGKNVADNYRVIAPSRFGYLKTPMPAGDASPSAQADAHAALLESLGIDQPVIVIGASAGALSAAEFAVKYPERVSALVLAVPAAWSPDTAAEKSAEIGSNDFIMNTVLKSDFIMWAFTKAAGDQMLSFLGVPPQLQKQMTPEEKEDANKLIQMILPVSQRYEGIRQDAINHENRQRLVLEQVSAPTIILDAKDVVTYPGSKYTAENIPNAKFVSFETGGHLLVGHADEARKEVSDFLQSQAALRASQ